MRIEVLGVGGCFSPELGNSSIVLWPDGGSGLLIDCGYTVFPVLKEKKLLERINKIFVTHKHGDHIGSLDTILYYKRYALQKKVELFGVSDLMSYLKEIDPIFEKEYSEFFIESKEPISIIPTTHTETVPSNAFYNYGLLYSGDTSESLLEIPEARDAKIILHEVSFNEAVNVHTPFTLLARAPSDVKRKTWLYHYNSGDFEKYLDKVHQLGFAGMLQKGQTLEYTFRS